MIYNRCLQAAMSVTKHVVQHKELRTVDVAESASAASVNGTVTLVRLCLGSSISASQYQIYQPEYSKYWLDN